MLPHALALGKRRNVSIGVAVKARNEPPIVNRRDRRRHRTGKRPSLEIALPIRHMTDVRVRRLLHAGGNGDVSPIIDAEKLAKRRIVR